MCRGQVIIQNSPKTVYTNWLHYVVCTLTHPVRSCGVIKVTSALGVVEGGCFGGARKFSVGELFVKINARREAHKTRRSPDYVIPSTPT